MDAEKSGLDVSETPQPEETTMEKEVVTKPEAPGEPKEPEKPPAAAAAEEPEQLPVNGHDTEVINIKTEEVIVTENVSASEDKSDVESVPAAMTPPEADESAEKTSDPVAALATEPENIEPEQQPVKENEPEPVAMQTPLAESVPEPEPEKVADSVPEAELHEQTLPEPITRHQPVDTQPPSQEENVSEQIETKAEPQTAMETAAGEITKEGEVKSGVTAEPAKEEREEKPADAGKAAEAETEKPADEKKVESDTVKAVEVAAAEGGESEKEREEDATPAPGTLSFALLEKQQTKVTLLASRTLVVLRGLPGSGKSLLARAIADAYKDHCSVVCADDHNVKPESPEASADGYKALDEAVVSRCSAGTAPVLIVVDDTNHSQDRLGRMGEIAREHQLVVIFLEPQTAWSRDVAQLSKKTRRGLEEAQLEAMKGPLEEMSIPLYFGWFLLPSVQDKVRCTAMDILKTLDTLEAFKKYTSDFTGKADKEVDLEQYFKAKGTLHCTTKFCDYGNAEGAKEYAEKPAVNEFYGSMFELSLSALFVTPRTVGARVSLTEEQLLLWPADAEKEAESTVPAAGSLPLGSRAHVTLGCAEGVQPVQTGFDLLDILALQQDGQKGELVEEMELGSLSYFGEGRWFLSLREPICATACFSSFYKRKKPEPTKKETEKKKKLKCAIL